MSRRALRVVLTPVAALLLLAGLVAVSVPTVREAVRRPVPQGLRSVAATSSTMTLEWAGVSSPRYRVAYSTSPTMSGARSAVFADDRGTLEGLQPGRTYWLRVAAVDHTGRRVSDWTRPGVSSGRTLYRGGFAFLPPQRLRVRPALRAIALRWRGAHDAPGYRVEVARTRSMADARTSWVARPATRVGGLRADTAYFVRVSVADRAPGSGALSRALGVRKVQTKADVPATYDLRVASYNVAGVLNDSRRNAPWSVRRSYVARQLLGLAPADQAAPPPDAMVVQEANTSRRLGDGATQYQELINSLNAAAPAGAHYAGLFANSNATRIIWNDESLELVDSGVLSFRAQELRVDGARMAPWAILRVKATKAEFFLLSAHLETASEGVRRAQWSQLIATVPGLAGGRPIVLGGDFNSPRKGSNRTAAAMLPRMRAAGFGDTLGQVGSGMVTTSSSRARSLVKASYNSVNRFHRTLGGYGDGTRVGQDVDYLFASNNLVVKRWEMVLDAVGRTLRGVVPSDHNMIRTVLELPTPSARR